MPTYLIPTILFALFWLFIWRRWDKKNPEPIHALLVATAFGALAAYAMTYFGKSELYFYFYNNIGQGTILTALLAAVEELVKLLGFLLAAKLISKHINQLVDALVYGAATALGFAFVENLLYFSALPASTELIIFRSLDAMFAHTLFTGIFAFYFAIAHAPMKVRNKKITISKVSEHPAATTLKDFILALRFHITRRHVLAHRPSHHKHRHTEVIFEGFWLATLAHFLHNILATHKIAGQGLAFLIPFLIAALALFAFSLFQHPWYTKIKR